MKKVLIVLMLGLFFMSSCALLPKPKPTLEQRKEIGKYQTLISDSYYLKDYHKLEKSYAAGITYDNFFKFKKELYKTSQPEFYQEKDLKKIEEDLTRGFDKWVFKRLEESAENSVNFSGSSADKKRRVEQLEYLKKVVPLCKNTLVSATDKVRIEKLDNLYKQLDVNLEIINKHYAELAKENEKRYAKSVDETRISENGVKKGKYDKLAKENFHYAGKILRISVPKDWYIKKGDSFYKYLDVEYGVKDGDKCFKYRKGFKKSPNGTITDAPYPKYWDTKIRMKCENIQK